MKQKNKTGGARILQVSLVASAVVAALATHAQTAPIDKPDAKPLVQHVEPITVTGQRENRYTAPDSTTASKTGTATRDIPASVQSIPAAALSDQAVVNMNEAVRNVSGVQPVYGGGYGYADNFVIRGLRIRFLRDGVADGPSMVGYARSFSDVESIDVLKGPGSAVYGRAEPGGVINVVTKQPLFTPLAAVSLTTGSRNTTSAQADVNGVVNDRFAVRVTGEYSNTDGIRGLEKKIVAGAVTALWQFAPNHRATVKVEHYDQRFVVDNFGIVGSRDGSPFPVDYRTRYYTPDNFADQTINRATATYSGDINRDLSVKATYRADDRDLKFKRNAVINFTSAGLIGSRNQRSHQDAMNFQVAQLEATLASDVAGIKGKTLFGVELERNHFDVRRTEFTFTGTLNPLDPKPEASNAGLTGQLIFDRKISSDTKSLYAQHEASIGSMVKLRGGYRMDDVDASDVGVSTATPVSGQAGPLNLKFGKRLGSGQFGAVFQPNKALSLYAGYAAGQFINIQSESTILSVQPESSKQIEAGVKWDVIDGKLNVNASVFDIKRRNYYVTLTPGGPSLPVGAQDGRGFELDVTGTVAPGVNVIANYAYLDAKIVATEIATVFAGTTYVRTGSIFGKEPQASPKQAASLWATFDLPLSVKGFSIGAGVTHKSKSYADSLNVVYAPAFTVGNAAIFWRSKQYDVALNVKNITDKRYFINPTFSGALPGDPRTFLLSVAAKF